MAEGSLPCGDWVLVAAALVSIQFAKGRTEEELGFLAAFFTLLGDQLALLALGRPSSEETIAPDGKNG